MYCYGSITLGLILVGLSQLALTVIDADSENKPKLGYDAKEALIVKGLFPMLLLSAVK